MGQLLEYLILIMTNHQFLPMLVDTLGPVRKKVKLSSVPVKIKANKGNKIVQTYAFLDPGSSSTFCTTDLMNQLDITGKKTNILLRMMNQEKTMVSNVVSGTTSLIRVKYPNGFT